MIQVRKLMRMVANGYKLKLRERNFLRKMYARLPSESVVKTTFQERFFRFVLDGHLD